MKMVEDMETEIFYERSRLEVTKLRWGPKGSALLIRKGVGIPMTASVFLEWHRILLSTPQLSLYSKVKARGNGGFFCPALA